MGYKYSETWVTTVFTKGLHPWFELTASRPIRSFVELVERDHARDEYREDEEDWESQSYRTTPAGGVVRRVSEWGVPLFYPAYTGRVKDFASHEEVWDADCYGAKL